MKLPNYNNAYIPLAKLNEYLLSETHIVGKSKTKFFQAVGFNKSNAKLLKKVTMIHELDTVVLSHDIKEHNLRKGDIGAVVHCYKNNTFFEVEFVTAGGNTIALLTLTQDDIRPIYNAEILHVRELASV